MVPVWIRERERERELKNARRDRMVVLEDGIAGLEKKGGALELVPAGRELLHLYIQQRKPSR